MFFGKRMHVRTWALATAAAAAISSPAYAQATRSFDIPAQPLSSALEAFGSQSGSEILFDRRQTAGKSASAVRGSMAPSDALQRLLAGSSLSMRQVNATTFVVSPSPQAVGAEGPATEIDDVVVTGSRIRGGSSPSPTITITEQQFQEEGFTDLGQVIRSVPQNFRGGQNPGVNDGASANAANRNFTGGSALNLRGLGPDATLTLLNGRRMSYDGSYQAVDISAIPIEAVERIEIVPDGASAIYGSDAVGGVANVILRRDFDGLRLGASYGDSTDGGLTKNEYSAIAGVNWSSGGALVTYKSADQDPLFSNQRNYTQSMDDPSTLVGGSELRSGLISAHHRFGDHVELRVDAIHTERETSRYTAYPTYSLATQSQSTVALVAPSLIFSLPRDWSLTLGASRGSGENVFYNTMLRNGVTTPSTSGCYCNDTETWEIGGEGPLSMFGWRDIRLAVGIGGRRDEYADRSFSTNTIFEGQQRNRFAYGELSLPVIGAENARPGIQRLEFSAAVRTEDYDSFGQVTTPKLGIIYDPSPDFTVKASWGRSFKAPTLQQRVFGRYTYLWRAQQLGCSSCAASDTVLMSFGANRDLEPERARTWTASAALHPKSVPGLDVELTYFSVDYEERIAYPFPNILNSLRNPDAYAEFIHYGPTVPQQQELIASYNSAFYNQAGVAYDPSRVIAIVSAQYTNVARQRARGLDLSGSYRFDLEPGQLVLRGGVSWLDLSQQNSASQDPFDLSGMLYFPAEWNGRLGVVWSRGGLSLSTFANYTSGVTSELTATPEEVASFTTFDTTLRYETLPGDALLSGLAFSLSVENVFNREPSLFTQTNPRFAPYDSTNYSAVGRYVTFSVSKHF